LFRLCSSVIWYHQNITYFPNFKSVYIVYLFNRSTNNFWLSFMFLYSSLFKQINCLLDRTINSFRRRVFNTVCMSRTLDMLVVSLQRSPKMLSRLLQMGLVFNFRLSCRFRRQVLSK
jgi:hypothetical protein